MNPKNVKTVIIIILLLIGFIYLIYSTDRADGVDNSINQNVSLVMENRSELVPSFGFRGESTSSSGGVFVTGITPEGPAVDAGIMEGDVIIKADNKSVHNVGSLNQITRDTAIGQILNFTLLRDSLEGLQEEDVRLIVGARPAPRYEEASKYSEPDNVNFSSYEDTIQSQHVTIQYPSTWNFTESAVDEEDSVVRFRSSHENSTDLFREYLELDIFQSYEGTLDELISVKQPMLNLTKPQNSTLGNNLARELEFGYFHDTYGEMKAINVATQIGNTTYLITYMAQASQFDIYWPTIERMISSFETFELRDYENFDIGMRVKYPSDWNKTEEPYSRTLFSESVPSVLFSPRAQNNSAQPSNELRIYSYPTDRSLNEEVNQTISNYSQTYGFPEFELREYPMNVSTSSLPFQMLNYSYNNFSGNKTNAVEFMTKSNDKIYSFIYSADEDDFPEYLHFVNITTKSLEPFELLGYENFDIGMRVKYPSDWNKTEEPYSRTLFSESVPSVLFSPRAQNNSAQPSNELRISSHLTDNSLDEEVNQTIRDYSFGYPELKFTSENLINLTDSSGASIPSYMLNYSYKDSFSDKNIDTTEIITNLTNRVYSIRYSAEADEFSKGLPALSRLIAHDSFVMYSVSRLELPVTNSSGIILRYPEGYPWDITKIDDKNINFMRNNSILPSIWQSLLLSVYPSNKSLPELENELQGSYDKQNFQILNEKKSDVFRTTLDGNVTAHIVEFSYHDPNNNEDIKGVQVFTVFNNNVFNVTYLTEPSRYDEFLPTVEKVIDSLKIITPVKDVGENVVARQLQGGLISDIEYPRSWNFQDSSGVGFEIVSSTENIFTDHFNESMLMMAGAAGLDSLGDVAGKHVNVIKQQNLTNFVLGDSLQINFSNNTAHKIIYSFKNDKYEDLGRDPCKCDLQVMVIFTIIDMKVYIFQFTAEQDKFHSYLPLFENIGDSIVIREKGLMNIKNKSGLPLNGSPVDLAFNPATNKLYVANPEARQIQVIDGLTDRVIQNISIGAYPNALALNQFTNRIYVVSPETDMIYVIDGITNNITSRIQAGPLVGDVAIDTNEFGGFSTLVFVSNQGGVQTPEGMMGSVSIIDDARGKVVANIVTEPNPFGIAIDTIRNRAYITTDLGVDVIDYSTSLTGRKVTAHKLPEPLYAGFIPTGIVVNSNTSRAYMTNSANDTVSVIDTASNEELKQIRVGLFPWSIAFNPSDKKLYVANSGINTVSIIDTTSDSNVGNITIDSIPSDVIINPNTNIVYLANPESRTISTIDANENAPVSAAIFHIHPPGAGHIECAESDYWEKFPENKYQRIIVDTQCKAIPNSGFKFSSWSEGEPRSNLTGIPGNLTWFATVHSMIGNLFDTSTNSPVENFTVAQYGTYTANFLSSTAILQALSPLISIGALLLVIVLAAVAPALHIRKKLKKEKRKSSERNVQTIAVLVSQADKIESPKEKDQDDDSPRLSRGEILTIDATVIIGVLLFLTLTEGFETSEQYQINIITASIVFPFAISAIIGVTKHERFATRLMIAGFINLMISVILIAGMKL